MVKRRPQHKKKTAALVEKVAAGLRKAFGEDVVDTASYVKPYGRIRVGIPAIDWITGGGIPLGTLTEIFGDYSTGKSMLCHHIVSAVQQDGGVAVLFDAEAAYMPDFGARLGIDNDSLLYVTPDTVEDTFDYLGVTLDLLEPENPKHICFVLDSLAALSTRHEMDTDSDTRDMTKAQVVGAGLRRATRRIKKMRVAFVIVNQIREKIGVRYGSPIFTPGGKSVKFHAAVRLYLQTGKAILKKDEPVGMNGTIRCEKNKTARPFRKVPFKMTFEEGFDQTTGLIEALEQANLLERSGAWYQLLTVDYDTGEQEPIGKRFQGKDGLAAALEVVGDEVVEGLLSHAEE